MGTAIDRRYILGLTVKTLRVCGVAGFVGFAVATAVNQSGADQTDVQATIPKDGLPSTSLSTVMFNLRQDRLEPSRRRTAKVDKLSVPTPASTHILNEKPITTVEIPDIPDINEPVQLAPWLEGETLILSGATAPEPATADPLDTQLPGPSIIKGFSKAQQQSRRAGSTIGTHGRAAPGVAGKAAGALGL